MTYRFAGKNVAVIGGTHGMGWATAQALVDQGARALVTGRNPANVQAARTRIGERALVQQADVASLADMDQLVATVRSTEVNKAMVAAKAGRLSAQVKANKLPPDKQEEAEKLYRDATSNLLDGRFAEANRKLNRIYSLIN